MRLNETSMEYMIWINSRIELIKEFQSLIFQIFPFEFWKHAWPLWSKYVDYFFTHIFPHNVFWFFSFHFIPSNV